jgi:hypothetical protein
LRPVGKKDSKPPPTDKETFEKRAASLFSLAKSLADGGKTDKARPRLADIIKKYPDTLAAGDARELLDKMSEVIRPGQVGDANFGRYL